jgi:gamma-glutamyltranspeptidase/glutathione hydrolase
MLLAAITIFTQSCSKPWPTGPGDVISTRAIVSSAHLAASQAGLEIIKKGGNAVDAAVAAAFALSLAEPNASGLGGGGFMLIKMADEYEPVMIDYREAAPQKATPDYYYSDPDFNAKAYQGPSAVGVPGMVAGLTLALEKYGTMNLAEVLEPAIRLAREGITVSPKLQGMILDNLEKIQKYPAAAAIYLPDGLPPEPESVLKNESLALVLERIAREGPAVFYEGDIGRAIAAEIQRLGGIMEMDDLKNYQPKLRRPISGTYHGYKIYSSAPPGGGTHLIELLNILEGFDPKSLGAQSDRLIHILAEAMKMVFADQSRNSGDPDYSKIPVDILTDKAYAGQLRERIKEGLARFDYKPLSVVNPESESTSHLSVVDEHGNAVALTQSINSFFGTGIVVPDTGILLNNHMADFDSKPGGPNSVGPGKRPASSIAPTIVLKDGRPFLIIGSPGATRIISALAQIIINIVDFGFGLDEAIEAPRAHCLSKTLAVEGRIPSAVVETLKSWGHNLKVYSDWDNYFGGAQGILIDPKTKRLYGAADSRRDGVAVGF